MTDLPPEELKRVLKQAIKEWMDEQAQKLGWKVISIATTAVIVLVAYFITSKSGFKFP